MPFSELKRRGGGRNPGVARGVRVIFSARTNQLHMRLGADIAGHTGLAPGDRYTIFLGNEQQAGWLAIVKSMEGRRMGKTGSKGRYPTARVSASSIGVNNTFAPLNVPYELQSNGVVTIDLRRIIPMQAQPAMNAQPYPEMGSAPFSNVAANGHAGASA